MVYAALGILGILCIANVAISWIVARAPIYSRAQKLWQMALVWLVPLVGAVTVWSILRQARSVQITERAGIDLTDQVGNPGGPGEHFNVQADAADIGGLGGH